MLVPGVPVDVLVLPAHAGVILGSPLSVIAIVSITRTCGGDPVGVSGVLPVAKYYPHMRG